MWLWLSLLHAGRERLFKEQHLFQYYSGMPAKRDPNWAPLGCLHEVGRRPRSYLDVADTKRRRRFRPKVNTRGAGRNPQEAPESSQIESPTVTSDRFERQLKELVS